MIRVPFLAFFLFFLWFCFVFSMFFLFLHVFPGLFDSVYFFFFYFSMLLFFFFVLNSNVPCALVVENSFRQDGCRRFILDLKLRICSKL